MKIFITGSTGFIGSNLVQFYKDHEIFEFKRYMNIEGKLDYFKPDLIINCAAEIYDKTAMWKVNVELTRACLEFCVEHPNTKMIQLGSSSEYGYNYSRATMESDAINPVDMYAGTKGIATTLCQTYGHVYKTDVVTLRPYSPYGPGERPHRLFPNLWRSFKLDRPMDLVLGVHDFCYIDDFISALDIVAQSERRVPGEVLNVSSGIQTSNVEVLEAFRTVTGKVGNVNIVNKFVTPSTWRCDNTKIKLKYGWSPKINLEQGIKLFLERAQYE
jgi:nucleoside-diphosphate-sugar epimerase